MRRLILSLAVLSWCVSARADFFSDFESPAYLGATFGIPLPGQQAWYTPAIAGTNPYNVFTYSGNLYDVATNPFGGSQFAAGVVDPVGFGLGRAQHDFDWSTNNLWVVQFDRLGLNRPGMAAANNLGSFSLQPSGTNIYMQSLYAWTDPNNPGLGYQAQYLWWDAAGVQQAFTTPGGMWDNQVANQWYRDRFVIDFATNRILSISITDLSTMASDTFNPTDWYMLGGASPTAPLPTAFRLFTGGSGTANTGNVMAWDNVGITATAVPEPGSFLALAVAGCVMALFAGRRRN